MAELELDDNLRRIGISKWKDPKFLLAKISALNIKYRIAITPTKKCDVILRVGQREHAEVMTITCTVITATTMRTTTLEEIVDVMHKQWQIQSNRERTSNKAEDDGHKSALKDVNDEEMRCYECGSCNHKRNQCPNQKKRRA